VDIVTCYKAFYKNVKTLREREKILSTRVYVIYRAMSIEIYYAKTNIKLWRAVIICHFQGQVRRVSETQFRTHRYLTPVFR